MGRLEIGLKFGFCVWVCAVLGSCSGGGYVKYNNGGGVVEGKLNVHLVPHSHDDVGWLKTIDQYYVGSNNSIQGACVENVLDSVVVALLRDPNRRFVFAEMAFFQRWWQEQSHGTQEQVRKLVHAGQLEFVNGGWCMHDEATTHYIDMIDQTTLGHRAIKQQFNKTPHAGWQIDPFGHSAVQAYLLGAEAGFDSVHFARVDYQDRSQRKADKSLEVIWRGSKTFGSSSQIFTNAFPAHYSAPNGFNFEVNDDLGVGNFPVQDDPLIFDYNVEQRVNDFVSAAMTQANVTRTNHIMWTMGDDFQYQYAESWFKQMDKLIHYVNKDGRVNALYSTPSFYTEMKNTADESWPLKTDDYFPYADVVNGYWTGFFTSRPALKRYVRQLSGYYMAARQLEFLAGRKSTDPNTYSLGDALGIAQHHDAVSGTAKQHTTNDYVKRLAIGLRESESTVSSALSCLVSDKTKAQCAESASTFGQCQLLNISYCPPSEAIGSGKPSVVVVYNPLGWKRTEYVRVPVNDLNLIVIDSTNKTVETQFVRMDNVTSKLRNFYVKAYLGKKPNQVPKAWLIFRVSVPPLCWTTYFIKDAPAIGTRTNGLSVMRGTQGDTVEIGPGDLKMSFSSTTGQLKRMYNSKTGIDMPIQQSFLWYVSSTDDRQPSGAYIFRPAGAPNITARSVRFEVIRGPLVDEIHQQFNSWISQVVRLYKDKGHAEFEYTIGPIPTEDSVGKEVITQITGNMVTNKVFYTDSNGRDFLKRIRDHRNDWNLSVSQPVAGNYYPINLGIFTTDTESELSVLVDRATGGGSIKDGQVELMLHRRLLDDDRRGVGEPLNETVSLGSNSTTVGLTVRGNYYLSINKLGAGAVWRRTTGQEIYSPLLLAFTQEKEDVWKASHSTKGTVMDPNYSLPPNVALITLQELDDGSVLLRLAHLYEAGEDAKLSALAKVELKKLFNRKTIKDLKEMSISANQLKSEVKKMNWKVEGDNNGNQVSPVRGGPVDPSALTVELGPMEIRTFLLNF